MYKVYLSPDCYTDTDLTVLKYLSKEYEVIWYYIHESIKPRNKISIQQAKEYASCFGIEIHPVDPLARYRHPKNLFFYLRIVKEINALAPDVVYHPHRDFYWCLAIRLALKCKNVVLGVHDAKSHSYKMTLSRFLEIYTKNYSLIIHRYFVTFSPNQHDLLLSAYGKKSCMVGMSYKDFGNSYKVLSSIEEGVKLLFFGSINEYKGLDILIEKLEKLYVDGIRNLKLTIVGRGDSWPKCKKYIKTEGLYNLHIRFIDNAEIPDFMSSHHFLVLPYKDATQSGPLAIAVAYELPIIAPAFGCFTETYNSESGILYQNEDIESALKEVSTMTQEKYDSLKKACIKVKDENREDRIAANYVKYFNSIISQ